LLDEEIGEKLSSRFLERMHYSWLSINSSNVVEDRVHCKLLFACLLFRAAGVSIPGGGTPAATLCSVEKEEKQDADKGVYPLQRLLFITFLPLAGKYGH
jgi:hypothetical protein